VDSEKQLVEQALQMVQGEMAVERASRQKAGQERDDAIAAPQEAEDRSRGAGDPQGARNASQAAPGSSGDPQTTRRQGKSMPTTAPSAGSDKVKQPRRRGGPAKSDQSEAEVVEWWKPGWQKRCG
jgi:hypothetical protein